MGDFNHPGINWIDGSGFTNSTSSEEQQFADFIMDHYFYQLVDKPARVNNILDLVLSNSPISIASVESGPSLADVGFLRIITRSFSKLKLNLSSKTQARDTVLSSKMQILTP